MSIRGNASWQSAGLAGFDSPNYGPGDAPRLADSGARETHSTGAVREPNPLRFDLIPPEPMRRLALHYGNGALKYVPRNWEKGLPMSRCFSSALNHLFKWVGNKVLRRPMEEDHLAAAAWNIFAIMTYEERFSPRILIEDGIDDISMSIDKADPDRREVVPGEVHMT